MIAISSKKSGFSEQWITYCNKYHIPFKLISAKNTSILNEIKNCKAFLWDYNHEDFSASLFSMSLLSALNNQGIVTFPDINDASYFDDKIAQTYLLQVKEINHPETSIFYKKEDALQFAEKLHYPIVAKLRKGAGGVNVFKITNHKEALRFINQSFGRGFRVFDKKRFLSDRLNKIKQGQKKKSALLKVIAKSIFPNSPQLQFPREKGYVYFQKFIENEGFDYRVTVINQCKAFSAKRISREGDFRASGSEIAEYPNENMPLEYIKKAFIISKKLDSICIAIDFIKSSKDGKIYTIEISHYYDPKSMAACTGFWTKSLKWEEDSNDPQHHLMDEIISQIND